METIPLLPPAMEYQARGLAPLPARLGQKRIALRSYNKYHRQRADDATVRQWFDGADSGQLGIAILCGEVSGGLLVRDFDNPAAYADWKRSHRSLARLLPTVETGRGYHVYCRSKGYKPASSRTYLHKFGDRSGELRGDGHIVIAPPSLHKTGRFYRWLNPLIDLPQVDLNVFGVTPTDGECNSGISVLHPGSGVLPPAFEHLSEAIALAIAKTAPQTTGQRNDRVFQFARYLKAIPELAGRSADDLMPLVKHWFQVALPHVNTRDFAVTANAFRHGWPKVRLPAGGEGSIKRALERAKTEPLPPEAHRFYIPEMRLLVALCKQLQIERGKPSFYLGCRDAAVAIGLPRIKGSEAHVRAWRMLERLCRVGVLRKLRSGSQKDHLANEYRYLGK